MTMPGHERLRTAMADLAADVAPADLHDRAVRTSRRLRRWRTTAAVAAVLVVASGGTATATQLWSAPSGKPATTVDGSSRCPATAVPTDPPPTPYYGPAENGPAPATGPLFYLTANGSSTALVAWTPGQAKPVLRRSLPISALMNANVSPDGRWVSWVTPSDGALHLAALNGGKTDRVLRTGVDGRLLEPVWSRDSARLLVRDVSSDRVGTVEVTTGTFTPLPTDLKGARHAVWAADGTAIAFIAPDGQTGRLGATPDPRGRGFRQGGPEDREPAEHVGDCGGRCFAQPVCHRARRGTGRLPLAGQQHHGQDRRRGTGPGRGADGRPVPGIPGQLPRPILLPRRPGSRPTPHDQPDWWQRRVPRRRRRAPGAE
jgi:hypothetical protein